jgi:serine/threonine protein kinase
VINGRYRLGELIGRGGMASVYAARDENLGRDVALKLFAPQSADADELKRQEAEIDLLATLNHPSLVTLFDAGIDTRRPDEPRPFLTMELIEGQDLRSRIRHSPVPLDELAVIGSSIADALTYVHGLGIIHRDIKPANILLVSVRPGERPRPKLTDFGIARIVDGTRLTAAGTMVGTAAYLSPEQARGADMGQASDIYSLGLVLLECIKGTVEYPGSAVASAVARLHRAPEIPASVPAEWAHLIASMTALDPEERPSAAALETAFRQALVSPGFAPGTVAEDHTRVLPAAPSRAPLMAEQNSRKNARKTVAAGTAALRVRPRSRGRDRGRRKSTPPSRLPLALRALGTRGKIAAVLAVVAVLAISAVIALSVSAPKMPDVVQYPTVTGTMGEHLKQLQQSVEP